MLMNFFLWLMDFIDLNLWLGVCVLFLGLHHLLPSGPTVSSIPWKAHRHLSQRQWEVLQTPPWKSMKVYRELSKIANLLRCYVLAQIEFIQNQTTPLFQPVVELICWEPRLATFWLRHTWSIYQSILLDVLFFNQTENTALACNVGCAQLSWLMASPICSVTLCENPKSLPGSCIILHELSILIFQSDALQKPWETSL